MVAANSSCIITSCSPTCFGLLPPRQKSSTFPLSRLHTSSNQSCIYPRSFLTHMMYLDIDFLFIHLGFRNSFLRFSWIAVQREMEELKEERNLPEDIVVEILCRLPKKSLARFKCVSKQWLVLISDCNRVHPKTTQVGLVCQRMLGPLLNPSRPSYRSRMAFLRVDHNGKGSAYLDSSDFDNSTMVQQQQHGFLFSSCNGFLVFDSQINPRDAHFVVSYPATKRSWHIVPPKPHNMSCVGLASDGNHFKLVCITIDDDPGNIRSLVFSSQNQEWLEESPPHSVPIPRQASTCRETKNSVFIRGSLYWIWWRYLLICHLQDGRCEFLDLPRVSGCSRWRQRQCIWESEGSLNYCNVSCGDRIGIWTLCGGNQYSFRWNVKHTGILAPPFAVIDQEGLSFISPVAFNDDLAIVYLEYEGKILSYNIATQEVQEACVKPFEGSDSPIIHTALPFLYCSQFDIATKVVGDGSL